MKRTEWKLAVRQTSLYTIYRTVMEKDGRYFVKDEGELWDVTGQKERFVPAWSVK